MIRPLLWMVAGAVTWSLATRKPKHDPWMGGRLIPRPVSYGPKPAEYTHPEALAWFAEQERLDRLS